MHAEAFYCPFCGEQDLWPHGAEHGTWECHGCLRAFQLKTLGLIQTPGVMPAGSRAASQAPIQAPIQAPGIAGDNERSEVHQ